MEVTDKFPIDDSHSIEWGGATWDGDDFSIRNRFNNEDGRFNRTGSSELPWTDFNQMIVESINRGHFTNGQIGDIARAIANYISTQPKAE